MTEVIISGATRDSLISMSLHEIHTIIGSHSYYFYGEEEKYVGFFFEDEEKANLFILKYL